MFSDLRNALFAGGTFVHTVQGSSGEGFKILHKHIAPGAMHNSNGDLFDQPKCHPKTVLRTIMQWIQDIGPSSSSSPSMLWVYGTTGVGKTAIARSIAEHCEELGLLVATFFFSVNVHGRNNTKQFISTIAYQLAQSIPTSLQYIERAVEKDPSIFDKTLKHQVQTLIVRPLKLSNSLPMSRLPKPISSPFVLVVDGLDECQDPLAHVQVLKILGSLLLHHELPLKILILSRPERHIRSSFETGSLSKIATKLGLDDDSFKADDDIRLFLSSEFDEIKETHPFRSTIPLIPTSSSWPAESIIEILVKRSAGQFMFAAAVIKYISSFDHHPHERLEDILLVSEDYTTDRILELLGEGPRRQELPNPHIPESFSVSSSSILSSSFDLPLRRRSVSPFLTRRLLSEEGFQRASSEPSFNRHARVPRIQHLTHSCPIPGCGAIFTRHVNFKVHLRAHKEQKNKKNSNSRCFQLLQCMGCRREFLDMDSLDKHMKNEMGLDCRKVVERCKMVVRDEALVNAATSGPSDQRCWEMDVDVDVATEMEVD